MGKYEEALERARQGKPIGEVFPELKDEWIRKALITIVKRAFSKYGVKCNGDEIGEEDLLAYLERHKEQNPTNSEKPKEWSKEDENYYDTIVRKLQVLGDDYGLTTSQIDFLDKHRPQPHWKPSEEQMEALAWYSGNSGVPPTGDKAIKSLYNDLKKLM